MMTLPRITIITPSFQQAEFLEQCLRSVHEQGYPDLEHIVVDGGSTDGSVAILERWSHRLAAWNSAPDGGQSAAINKGLARASGAVVAWLNSDDQLLPGTLARVGSIFAAQPDLHTVTGARVRLGADGIMSVLPSDVPGDVEAWAVSPRVNQSSTFMRTAVVRSVVGVDERLHHVMDLELWWQLLFRNGADGIRCIEDPLSVFRIHAQSKSHAGHTGFVQETAWILQHACREVGAHGLADVLAIEEWRTDASRPLGLGTEHRRLVERMALNFLFKWYRHLHTASDLRRMKALGRMVEAGAVELGEQAAHWEALRGDLAVPGWLAHRIRRKWRSLRR